MGVPEAPRSRGRWSARRWVLLATLVLVLLVAGAATSMAVQGLKAHTTLTGALPLASEIEDRIRSGDTTGAAQVLADLQRETAAARSSTSGPVWSVASVLPWIGPNVDAATVTAAAVDDVAQVVLPPLVETAAALDWSQLNQEDGRIALEPLVAAAPQVTGSQAALDDVRASMERIDPAELVDQLAGPVEDVRTNLDELAAVVATGARAARLVPAMLGADGPRRYLFLAQNNAELRSSGGIAGAMSIVTAEDGRLSINDQVGSRDVGPFAEPVLPLDEGEQAVYGDRLGRFVQDVNLTPDFPTAAALAARMWQQAHGVEVDGVLATDPVGLSHILAATGPVPLPEVGELTSDNAATLLMSDVYELFPEPAHQDVFFAATAALVFQALTSGAGDTAGLVNALALAADEGRLLIWSAHPEEQEQLQPTVLSGAFDDVSPSPAALGVFLNDGTAAKMSYYLDTSVQVRDSTCGPDARVDTLAVTLTSTAPADAEAVLPPYVTGFGEVGLTPGTVRTNVTFYGAGSGEIRSVRRDGALVASPAYDVGGRPVQVFTVDLEPGQSAIFTVEMAQPVGRGPVEVVTTPTALAGGRPAVAEQCE